MTHRPDETSLFYRRRLPHWQPDGAILFVNWRLAGSLPASEIEALRREQEDLRREPPRPNESPRDRALRVGKRMFALTDEALARQLRKTGDTPRWLGVPAVAAMVRDSLKFWDGVRYCLHRYVIMPNHTHVLLEPLPMAQDLQVEQAFQPVEPESAQAGKPAPPIRPTALRVISQGLKGYTARQANALLGRRGMFWQNEGFDHWVRDEAEYARIVEYIDENPVAAGLCGQPQDWPWSSAAGDAAL